ncbi:MAG: ATP-binding protein [Candidatus Absconditabacteria bacterium]|nr:ATP-binding protein [Candidatus Absconditabacteria bacterium]
MGTSENNEEILRLTSENLKHKQTISYLSKIGQFSYKITRNVNKVSDLTEFCKIIHQELMKIIACENFYIALYDDNRKEFHFPYHVDKYDKIDDDTYMKLPGSLTDYIRRSGKAMLIDDIVEDDLYQKDEIVKMIGEPTSIWMGTPLFSAEENVIGVVAVQNYEDKSAYKEADLSLLKQVSRFIGVEIELLRAKQNAEKANKLKSEFLANVSHEIRTPMNAIMGFAGILSRSVLSLEQQDYCYIIETNGQKLLDLLDDVLDLSKIESGNVDLKIEEVDLKPFFQSIFFNFTNTISLDKKESIDIVFSNKSPDIKVYLDPKRLQQIVDNLITNSIKFTEKGLIKFGYTIVNDFIEIEVKDTGLGIVEEYKDKIFEKFYRIQDDRLSKNGQGLGLAICKSLVTKMGGEIWVENNDPCGSSFRFKLPYRPVESVKSSDIKNNTEVFEEYQKLDFTDKVILLVDDESINILLLETILKATNAVLISAKNSQEAIDFVLDQKIDLILMDCKMDGNSKAGIYATKEILKHRQIPIIMQTAYVNGIELEAMQAGCVGYISKPINHHQLLLMINKYL